MTNEDKKEFMSIMAGVAENFSSPLTDAGLKLRFECLKSYDLSTIRDSAMIILRTRKYTTMPTIADFVEAIEGSNEDLSEMQASSVLYAISSCGSYNPPNFRDPITENIIKKVIGWTTLCGMNQKDLDFKMKEFKQLYKSYNKVALGHMVNPPGNIKGLLKTMTKEIE